MFFYVFYLQINVFNIYGLIVLYLSLSSFIYDRWYYVMSIQVIHVVLACCLGQDVRNKGIIN